MSGHTKVIKRTKRLTLCAVFCALGVVLMYLGVLTGVLDISAVVFTSLLNVIIVIEYGGVWPWMVYGVTGILSLLLLPDKYCAVLYIAFAGYYPMLKEKLEKYLKKWLAWVLKLIGFNIALAAVEVIAFFVLNVETEGYIVEISLFLLGNLIFVIYDFLLTRLITLYLYKFRKHFRFF